MSTPHYRGTLPWDDLPPPSTTDRPNHCRYCGWPIYKHKVVCLSCAPLYKQHRTKARHQTARLIELAQARKDPQ